jgi:hypothetical protein
VPNRSISFHTHPLYTKPQLFAPQKASLTFCEAKYIAAPKGAISLSRKAEYRSPQGEYR